MTEPAASASASASASAEPAASASIATDAPVTLFFHPFSSYCWKALIPLYERAAPFTPRRLDPADPSTFQEMASLWPVVKFPLLADGDRVIPEASIIVEYMDRRHPGPPPMVPTDPEAALETRMMDRIFDLHVQEQMQRVVADALAPEAERRPSVVADATARLDRIYGWLDARMTGRDWAAGDFGLADCAAAPALFYADWVHPIPEGLEALRAYRARLLARPSVARVVEEARPYRALFPLGAPDRD